MLQGVLNFRDIGGHPTRDGRRVRTGRVYRSAHLASATDDDLLALERLGVGVVIDFRGPHDIAEEGEDRLPAGARLVPIPMYDPARGADIRALLYSSPPEVVAEHFGEGRAFEAMVRGATTFVTSPDRVEQFGLMFHTIVESEAPVVIHCSAGKDRTGWGASLLLLALDVPEEVVVEHYLESNNHRRDRAARLEELARAGVDPSVLEPFFVVREEYAHAALAALGEHWGGIDGYLRDGLRVGEDKLARFRASMLEE
jgi:protein-tyrosine phosphatase